MAAISLQPALIPVGGLDDFQKSQLTLVASVSPRGNGVVAHASSKAPQGATKKRYPADTLLYFASWDHIPESTVEFYCDTYLTFTTIQKISKSLQNDAATQLLSDSQITNYYSRSIEQYINDAKKQIASLASHEPIPSTYPTYVNILETLQLVQTVYAPHGGQIDGLVGEQLLQWLNTSHTVPATSELLRLSALPEPWSDPDFWPTVNKCVLRGLSASTLGYLRRVASGHPSPVLRAFVRDSLVPVLEAHPRSSDFQREHGFIAAHARWRERVAEVREAYDKAVEGDTGGEGDEDEWPRWVDELLGVLEGDAGVVFALCSEAVEDGWGFREAVGVWGVWVDVGLKRTQLAKVVEKVVEEMPPDPTVPVQELHRAVLAMEELEASEALQVAAQLDPWLAAHLADIFEKVGALDPHDEIVQTYGMSIRDHFVLAYAEHLHSDPTLFEIELEYMGRCGTIGRERIAAVIGHISVIPPPADPAASTKSRPRLKSLGVDEQGLPITPRIVDAGMWDGYERVNKLLSVCDQFGLPDESREICKVVAQHLTRDKHYGLAISYCAFANDVRGVGRIATLLLEEYVQHGSAEFVKHVGQIPARHVRVNATDPITARLEFVARFADFHTFSDDGAKGEAVRLLVRMLDRSIVPRAWQAVVLLDAASLLQSSDDELLITTDDAYELLRYLQNIYTQAALGAGADYLQVVACLAMKGKGKGAESEALQSLDIERCRINAAGYKPGGHPGIEQHQPLVPMFRVSSSRTFQLSRLARRGVATISEQAVRQKKEGDISAIFPSLSGVVSAPLPPRFSQLKKDLLPTTEARDRLVAGWVDLLSALREGVAELQAKGNDVIPEVGFAEIERGGKAWHDEVRKRGSVVVRDVIDDKEALGWKQQVLEYVRENPQVKGFPPENKQVFELYWSKPQVLARSHPNLLKTSQAVLSLFSAEPEDQVSLSTPISYADRLRVRLPGDAKFALGPHIDGGGLERWEDAEYRKCYTEILSGNWRKCDLFKIGPRLNANSDLYHAPNQCSVFRGFQGWLSLSNTGPNEGTLRVYPFLRESVAYVIMRPFFRPRAPISTTSPSLDELKAENWVMDLETSEFPGAVPGSGQELNALTHPHLMLDAGGMVSMKPVRPGDMVFWHCDGIHAVESKHAGQGDSSVFYIPAAPLTTRNAEYLAIQRGALVSGFPAPDFPGGVGESEFVGAQRGRAADVKGALARSAMGLEKFAEGGATGGELAALKMANQVLAPLL